jgi:hypothetical protein
MISTTLGSLIAEVDELLMSLEGLQLKSVAVKQKYSEIINCLNAINNGVIPNSACPQGNAVIQTLGTHSMNSSQWDDDAASTEDTADEPVAIEAAESLVELYRPWPNPFTQNTRVAYLVGGEGEAVQIGVYDAAGRRIRSLVSGVQPAGRREAIWDGRMDDGGRARQGVYFVRIVVGGMARNMRLIYLQ